MNHNANELSELNNIVYQCQEAITDTLHRCGQQLSSDRVTTVAHLLSIAASYNYPFGVSFQEACRNSLEKGIDVSSLFAGDFPKSDWEKLTDLCRFFDSATFAKVATLALPPSERREEAETPEAISKIASRILNIQPNEEVADLCCGRGGVILELEQVCPAAFFIGYERNNAAATIGEIRLRAAKSNARIETMDVFSLVDGTAGGKSFDKIFSNYPFGINLRQLDNGQKYLHTIADKVDGIHRATSSDWLFNHLMLDLLKKNGKAVGIMTNGSTLNGIDRNVRKYFADNGFVEAIIALPGKLFATFGIPTTMIVLSHGNRKIRMIDATEQFSACRRQNVLTDENIAYIVEAYYNDTNISCKVSLEDIQENDYVLNPKRYLASETTLSDGVPFGELVTSISRGAHCSAEQLDAMASQIENSMSFLKTSDIQDGLITGPLQPLAYIEDNFVKYCLKDRDLIISKMGAPYKVAVASIQDGQKILANANLYIVTVDEKRVDPYYLKAYLESAEGQAQLKKITVGATVQSIGVKDLKAMPIPLLPMEKQKRIAAEYKAAAENVLRIKEELREAIERMNCAFSKQV